MLMEPPSNWDLTLTTTLGNRGGPKASVSEVLTKTFLSLGYHGRDKNPSRDHRPVTPLPRPFNRTRETRSEVVGSRDEDQSFCLVSQKLSIETDLVEPQRPCKLYIYLHSINKTKEGVK